MAGRFGALSRSGQTRIAFLRSGIRRGLSDNAILGSLSAAGQGYRRATFLADMAALRGDEQQHDRLRFVRKDRMPDPSRLPPARTKTLRSFAVVAEVRGRDSVTGERTSRFVTISTSRLMTIGELEEIAAMIGNDLEHYDLIEDATVTIRSAVQAGGAGTLL